MEREQRYSRKREAIRDTLMQTKEHPSAETIYERLKPAFPDLSLGTVYRNLALFRQEGAVSCVATVHGQDRFDGDTHPHAHFICEKCGRVIDLEADLPSEMTRWELPGRAREAALTIYGVCNHCE